MDKTMKCQSEQCMNAHIEWMMKARDERASAAKCHSRSQPELTSESDDFRTKLKIHNENISQAHCYAIAEVS